MAGKGRRDNSDGINIGARSFLIAIGIIFILMVATYVLTLVIPGGEYARIVDESGHTVIDTDAGFHYVEGGIPFWKWLRTPRRPLSPPSRQWPAAPLAQSTSMWAV